MATTTSPISNHRKLALTDISRTRGILNIPDYIKKANKAYSLWKDLKAMAEPGNDLKLDEALAQYDFLVNTYGKISEANDNLTQVLITEIKNLKLTTDIMEIQQYQFSLLADIQVKIDAINSMVNTAVPNIMKSISSVSKINDDIINEIRIANIVILSIYEEIRKIRNTLSVNNMMIHINQPYHFLIYACDTYDQLSKALDALNSTTLFQDSDAKSIIDSKELHTLFEFATTMCEEGSNGIIYNIDVLFNEMSGKNVMSDKIVGRLASYIFNTLSDSPASNSALSILASTITEFNFIIVRAMSTLIVCSNLINKNIDTTIDHIGGIIKEQTVLLIDTLIDNIQDSERMTILSTLYTDDAMPLLLNSGIGSDFTTVSMAADEGNAIVGIEFAKEGDKCIVYMHHAKINEKYIVDSDNVSIKKYDMTSYFLGENSWLDIEICIDRSNKKSTIRRFKDDYILAKIDFITTPLDNGCNCEIFACKYDKTTGTLGKDYVKADETNSVDISDLLRSTISDFYESTDVKPGVPVAKLIDGNLAPLKGFYFLAYGPGQGLDTNAAIFMTDSFIDQQIVMSKDLLDTNL